MAVKTSLGKLRLPKTLFEIMDECVRMGIDIADMTMEDCVCVQGLPFVHRDPFDRMIISQAITEKMTLVTHDGLIRQYKEIETIW